MRGSNPCWQCEHFGGWRIGKYAGNRNGGTFAQAVCGHPKWSRTIGEPQFGCVDWQRMPGSDDEPDCIDPTGRRWSPGTL